MKLHHLSANSLKLWLSCPAQWQARYEGKLQGDSGQAATLGGMGHSVLERFVAEGFYLLDDSWPDLFRLFSEEFANESQEIVSEYLAMVRTWHDRQDWAGREVLSTEQRSEFTLHTKYGPVPFVFIIDRADAIDGIVEVWDYKTGNYMLTLEEMRNDIQCKSYATATWLAVPAQNRYWVNLDYLRDKPLGVGFTAEECQTFYDFAVAQAEWIIETDQGEETINPGCRFCDRKEKCAALAAIPAEVAALSFAGMVQAEPEQLAQIRQKMLNVAKAAEAALKELDPYLKNLFKNNDELIQIPVDEDQALTLGTARGRRYVDHAELVGLVPAEAVAGFAKLSLEDVEDLAKSYEAEGDLETAKLVRQTVRRGTTRQGLRLERRDKF